MWKSVSGSPVRSRMSPSGTQAPIKVVMLLCFFFSPINEYPFRIFSTTDALILSDFLVIFNYIFRFRKFWNFQKIVRIRSFSASDFARCEFLHVFNCSADLRPSARAVRFQSSLSSLLFMENLVIPKGRRFCHVVSAELQRLVHVVSVPALETSWSRLIGPFRRSFSANRFSCPGIIFPVHPF